MPQRCILVVEDDDGDQLLLKHALQQTDQEVFFASDGGEALRLLYGDRERQIDPMPLPELALLDLHLPDLDGLEILSRIRAEERTRRIPVVVLTSSEDDCDVIKSYDLGANSFVNKPPDGGQFIATIRRLRQYWTEINRRAKVE